MHIRIVFIAPKAESRCSHLCRKKSGAPFSHVKLSFLIWHMASILILRRCFYLHALHGLREIKIYEGPRYAKVELRFLRVCCLTLLFLLFGEGSAVFTFREIRLPGCLVWRSADCHHLISSRSHGTNSSSSPDRMWVPQWGPARCNDRRQRGLLWTSHCRAHQGHPAYVHCLPH